MLRSETVREAATATGIHRNTSSRWRHCFLNLVKGDRSQQLHGIAEVDGTYILESEKGARCIKREIRKCGSFATKRGIYDEQVCYSLHETARGRHWIS